MLSAQLLIALGLAGMAMSDPQAHPAADRDLRTAGGIRFRHPGFHYRCLPHRGGGPVAAGGDGGQLRVRLPRGAAWSPAPARSYIAAAQSWQYAYFTMACLMGIGVVTTLIIAEPAHPVSDAAGELESEVGRKMGVKEGAHKSDRLAAWFASAVVSPFVEFFRRNGLLALVILLLIGTFRLSDITMGVMANPFYLDLGFSKIEIANITKIFGFFMTILGAGLGGIFVLRYGIYKPLLLGAILVPVTNLFFVWLAMSDPDTVSLAVVISMDNLSGGFATSAFIAYLSSLTNTTYTATQYALFSSLMTLPAKIIGGFSGIVVEAAGYAWFFLYAGVLGAPALLLIIYLMRKPLLSADDAD